MEKRKAKDARIDGTANEELADGCAELTARVEFFSEKYRLKSRQPATVDDSLVGGMMAKSMVQEVEEGERTETWEIGRLKKTKKISVALLEGGSHPQRLFSLGRRLMWLAGPRVMFSRTSP